MTGWCCDVDVGLVGESKPECTRTPFWGPAETEESVLGTKSDSLQWNSRSGAAVMQLQTSFVIF